MTHEDDRFPEVNVNDAIVTPAILNDARRRSAFRTLELAMRRLPGVTLALEHEMNALRWALLDSK